MGNGGTYQPGVASASNATVKSGGTNTYTDSGNVLKVSYFIRDNGTGIEFGDNAVHIANFLNAPSITNQQYGVSAGDLNGLDFPDLNGAGMPGDLNGLVFPELSKGAGMPGGGMGRTRFNRLRRAGVLGATRIINEWSANPANGVQMDWVVTLPGQYTMLNLPQYLASLGADRAWVSTVDSTGNAMDNPGCPRTAIPANTATGAAMVAACDFRDLPIELTLMPYNRDERTTQATAPSGTLVAGGQPPPPPAPKTSLAKVANVITFGGNSVLGQRDANVNADLGQPFGWVEAKLTPQKDPGVCDWSGPDSSSPSASAAANLSMVCSSAATVIGGNAPVIGFAAWSRKVAANPNASYGRIVEHSYRGARASGPVPSAPGMPTSLRATAGDAQVGLSWTAVSGATRYTVYYSTSTIGDLTAAGVSSVSVTGTGAMVTNLTNGTPVFFRVTASNAVGESPASAQTSATPAAPTTAPGAPTNLRATAGNARVEVSWTAVSGATRYTIYYSTSMISDLTAAGVNSVSVTGIGTTTTTVTNLTNDTLYYFRVTASNAVGESPASAQTSATPTAPPGAPTGLRVTAGNGQMTVSWAQVSGATRYTVYYSTSTFSDITASTVISVSANGTSATITGLTNGTQYYVRVIASNAAGESAASAQISATPAVAPGAPTNLRATAGNAQVEVSWTAVSGATRYTVYYSTSMIGDLTAAGVSSVSVTGTGAMVTNLTNGTPVFFRVTASNAIGESAASSEASATPQVPAPDAPTGLSPSAGDRRVTVNWTAVNDATRYTVYYSQSTISDITAAGVNSVSTTTGTSAPITGLDNGRQYYFKVTATNAGGESVASSEASATPQVPVPTGLSLTAADAQVAVSWTAVTDATSYTVYHSTSPITSLTAAGVTAVANLTGTTTTVTNLTNGTQYYVRVTATTRVTAITAGGESAASSEASATPQAAVSVPGAPTNLGATASPFGEQVTLSWTAVNGATGYKVYYSQSSISDITASTVISVSANGTSATITGLTNDTQYYFKVTATNAVGESAASSEASATPQVPVPDAPIVLRATAGDARVRLTWTDTRSTWSNTMYYSTSPISDLNAAGVNSFNSISSRTVTGLTNDTLYYFRVTGTNGRGEGPASAQTSATPVALPGAPTNLRATAGGAGGQVTLSWTPVDGAVSYTAYYSTSPISSSSLPDTWTRILTGNTIALSDLTSGTLYYFRVTATNASGESPASAQASATAVALTVPGAPTLDRLTAGDSVFGVRWSPAVLPNSVSFHTIYSSSSPISDLTAAGVRSQRSFVRASGLGAWFDSVNASNDRRRYVRVTATNAAGESPASAQMSVIPRAAAVLDAPTNLRVTANNDRLVTLSWTAVSGVGVVYQVAYDTSPISDSGVTNNASNVSPQTTTTIDLNIRMPLARYVYFRVRAINEAGRGPFSADQVFVTVP